MNFKEIRFDSTELEVLVEEAYKHPNDLQRRNINITQRNLILDQHLCQSKRHREIKENSGGTLKKVSRSEMQNKCKTLLTSCWQNNKIILQPLITGYHSLHREWHTWAMAAPTKQLVSTMSGLVEHCDCSWEARNHIKNHIWFVKCFQCS